MIQINISNQNNKKAFLVFIYFILLIIGISTSRAQNNKANELSNYINELLKDTPIIPAVSVAVVTKDGIQLADGFGISNLLSNIPATGDTNFYLASITKSFNGLLAHILADEGVLDLNKPITEYKPFKNFKRKEIFKNISIQNLLSHKSGIKGGGLLDTKLAYYGNYTDAEILDIIENKTRLRKKGKSFSYTNYGYYFLDVILKAEFNKSWRDLLKERIFDPLNMKTTTAYISEVDKELLARPYSTFFPENPIETNAKKTDMTMHAAGGLVSNANDIANFLTFYLNDGNFNAHQVYPKQLVRQTYKKQIAAGHNSTIYKGKGYASGWRLGKYNGKDVAYHFGGYKGWFAHLSFLPEKKIGIAVFVNHDYGRQIANLIATKAYNIYLGETTSLKPFQKILSENLRDWKKFGIGVEKLNQYDWNLSLPKEAYSGNYQNPNLGNTTITYEEGDLYIKIGHLKGKTIPYSEKNTMLVELYSHTRKKIKFSIEAGKIKSLFFDNKLYIKN